MDAFYSLWHLRRRSPGCGISLEAFDNDPVFTNALQSKNGLAAAERIEDIAPFLVSFVPPKGWRQNKELNYPNEFIETDGHPYVDRGVLENTRDPKFFQALGR